MPRRSSALAGKSQWHPAASARPGSASFRWLYAAGRIALFGSFTGRLPPPYGLDITHPWSALQGLALNLAVYTLDLGLYLQVDLVYLSQFWRDHPAAFAACLAVAALILLVVAIVGRSRVSRIGLAWLAVFAAPSLLSMPGERNIYLASVGLAVFVGAMYRALDTRSHPPALPQSFPADRPPAAPGILRGCGCVADHVRRPAGADGVSCRRG